MESGATGGRDRIDSIMERERVDSFAPGGEGGRDRLDSLLGRERTDSFATGSVGGRRERADSFVPVGMSLGVDHGDGFEELLGRDAVPEGDADGDEDRLGSDLVDSFAHPATLGRRDRLDSFAPIAATSGNRDRADSFFGTLPTPRERMDSLCLPGRERLDSIDCSRFLRTDSIDLLGVEIRARADSVDMSDVHTVGRHRLDSLSDVGSFLLKQEDAPPDAHTTTATDEATDPAEDDDAEPIKWT
eukprot:CAMPEP_0194329438 /NCGR_PEP_ID=MMETSP0171-20130528/48291_1 /TAXON_ID=218684 /ORGANISM="Corethron pennatum, Strain L29A3" /LENGTH=244 /DNA_ID=CAMNT_0039090177 /DNA_START=47 /DNA_END=777 /DNA_ORIENTATION=+